MAEINLLESLPKIQRNLDKRSLSSREDKLIAKQFGREFFDGPREQGYGGYRYDGRWRSVARRLKEHYGLSEQSRVLDVGCAKGFLLHDLKEEVPGISVAGIDVSAYAIGEAMDSIRPFVQVADARALPFPDRSFDLVLSINTIHNLELQDLFKSLLEIERVSRAHKFIVVDAYQTEEERERILKWNLTAETHMYCKDWEKAFLEVGYQGDYFWFTP